MISLHIVGNLGADAVVKEVNGKKVIEFTVAHTEQRKDAQGNKIQKTTWVSCSKWGDTTAVAPYMLKGGKVYVEGVPSSDAWIKDGEAKSTLRLMVNRIELLGGGQQAGATQPTQQPATQATQPPAAEEELPF